MNIKTFVHSTCKSCLVGKLVQNQNYDYNVLKYNYSVVHIFISYYDINDSILIKSISLIASLLLNDTNLAMISKTAKNVYKRVTQSNIIMLYSYLVFGLSLIKTSTMLMNIFRRHKYDMIRKEYYDVESVCVCVCMPSTILNIRL